MTPDVSIIIAAYNVEKYLQRAIESALAQENVSVEVILVDDCSTDGTLEVMRRVNDPRLTVLPQSQNVGPGAARNIGFNAARGRWIAVLDGDDAMESSRLFTCIQKADRAGADIVVDDLLVVSEQGERSHLMFGEKLLTQNRVLTLEKFIAGNVSFLGGMALGYMKPILSRAFLNNNAITYDPDVRIGEDYLLLADCLAAGARCVCEPSAGYLYTARVGSTSHRMTLNDVQRIQGGDSRFLTRHRLTAASTNAQKKRVRALDDAWSFTQLVEMLKAKQWGAALKISIYKPRIIMYLWRPILAKIKKIFGYDFRF